MTTALNTNAAIANDNGRDSFCRKYPSYRFSLRTLLIAITVVAVFFGYLGWAVHVVQRRDRLLRTRVEHHAYIVMSWEDDPNWPYGIKDVEALRIYSTFRGWSERAADPSTSVVVVRPTDRRKLSLLRRWLGDRRVDNIFLTDAASLNLYSEAFPEAVIVVDPAAKTTIADRERQTKPSRRQLTNHP